jgi:hypothetical protein
MKIKNSFLIVLLILILVSNITYAKYFSGYRTKVTSDLIAIPVMEVWTQNEVVSKLSNNESKVYNFSVRNYSTLNVSQVDMCYTIEVLNSNSSFPVQFELYDEELNQIELQDNISEILEINKEDQEEIIYTLVAKYNENNNQEDCSTNVGIKINAWQKGV